LAKTWKPN